ncbi:MAG: hypothetical protein GJV46_12390 [Geobacter sp.]|nr:hypothetical protein [Geobacter sp.]
MTKRLLARIIHRLQLRESWIIFFILGIIMMTFPFMNIFNKPVMLFGFPLMFLYLTIGWAFSIFIIYIFMRSFSSLNQNGDENKD